MHGHQGGLPSQRPQTLQHRPPPRHHPHQRLPHPGLRVRGEGPEAVPGRLLWHHEHDQRQGEVGCVRGCGLWEDVLVGVVLRGCGFRVGMWEHSVDDKWMVVSGGLEVRWKCGRW